MKLNRSSNHKQASLSAIFALLLLDTIVCTSGEVPCGIIGEPVLAKCGAASNTTVLTLRVEIGNATSGEYCNYYWLVEWGDGITFGVPYSGESLGADPKCQSTDPTLCPVSNTGTLTQEHTYGEAGTYEIRNLVHVQTPSSEAVDFPFIVPDSFPVIETLEITEGSCAVKDPSATATSTSWTASRKHLWWLSLMVSAMLLVGMIS